MINLKIISISAIERCKDDVTAGERRLVGLAASKLGREFQE